MRSLASRLAALEEHFAVQACTCPPLTVLHQAAAALLTEEEIRSRVPSDCPVHRGKPQTLVVCIKHYSPIGATHGQL